MPKLNVIVVSTRPKRLGLPIAHWFTERAKLHGKFDVELVDLKAINLPLLDEPNHPRVRQYQHDHTKAWSASVSSADAFVFVTPEYNYFAPAPLVNALDYLFHEWQYKAAGFCSYGGISGGMRSVQSIKPMLTTLSVMPIVEAVNVVGAGQLVDEQGTFRATEAHERAATSMLDELVRWAVALRTMRVG